MLSRIDEKVTARSSEILRLVHEDIAGVELRLSARMNALEIGLRKEMTDFKVSMIRWMVSLMFVQGGLMIVIAWASKHLF